MTRQFTDAGRIYLVGYRGAGKSTVGPLLANQLGWAFADTDDEIIAESGKSIADHFANAGEPVFRRFEAAVLQRLSTGSKLVVATGGGIVLSPENRNIISKSGFAIWLRAPSAVLLARIQGDPGTQLRRPHLVAGGSLQEVETLLCVREPHYASVAKLVVDTAGRSPDEVVSAILASC